MATERLGMRSHPSLLQEFLANAQLETHANALTKLGLTEIDHLTDAGDEDFKQAGMMPLEIKRLDLLGENYF